MKILKEMKQIILFFILLIIGTMNSKAQTTNLTGPSGSGNFGKTVTVLPNGNFVVTDPLFDNGAIQDVGAVHLYNGSTFALISTLKGSTANDMVGNSGIIILGNGNYLVRSGNWNNSRGAVTWCSGNVGVNGVVNSNNSLVGSTSNDQIGSYGILVLSNSNYVVNSSNWDNGSATNAGAVTWGSGIVGVSGVVSSSNSLIGSTSDDRVGSYDVVAVGSNNYVVITALWDNGNLINAGAVTWGSGATGVSGVINSNNSLVGLSANNSVGESRVTVLSNGNYVVKSRFWDNGAATNAGAVTWGSGSVGISGGVSSNNSLVGSSTNDQVGTIVTALPNGNYLVRSSNWDNGAIINAGAVTWGSGTIGISGVISSGNSLVGSTNNDNVGGEEITILNNSNYVVSCPSWDNGTIYDAGAVTWGSGTGGINGAISSNNSLVSTTVNSFMSKVTALPNGNYVVSCPGCTINGTLYGAGAVTWGSGSGGISGQISSSNSLVGSTSADLIGGDGITILSNSNYLVRSSSWDNGTLNDAGAVTWCSGTSPVIGVVSSINSLVCSIANKRFGLDDPIALSNGNYVLTCANWDNGTILNAGAVTWGSGTVGVSGVISSSNSLVGSSADDKVSGVTALPNGNYVVRSTGWDNGAIINVGAVTWGNGTGGISGIVSSSNSLVGSSADDRVGNSPIIVLSNHNYIIKSWQWDNGSIINAGAVTWCSGTAGLSGTISSGNSLVGSSANDQVGTFVTALSNGNYVINSPNWDNGTNMSAGAVTWGSGNGGLAGVINNNNSLVGSTNNQLGSHQIIVLNNGNYIVNSPNYDNGTIVNSGAVTFGSGTTGVNGLINSCNSVIGNVGSGGSALVVAYNYINNYIVVGKPSENIVSIFNPTGQTLGVHLDSVSQNLVGIAPTPFINNSCRINTLLLPTGANPISGNVKSKLWVETTQPTDFVKRHYEITPSSNANTSTGKVTLYFTQQEFNDFNSTSVPLKLPTGTADVSGKANLRVEKHAGTSSDGSGLPGTYTGTPEIIDPVDADIVWNATTSRWEISFEVTSFSGFFIKTGCNLNVTNGNDNGPGSLRAAISCSASFDTIKIQAGAEIIILNNSIEINDKIIVLKDNIGPRATIELNSDINKLLIANTAGLTLDNVNLKDNSIIKNLPLILNNGELRLKNVDIFGSSGSTSSPIVKNETASASMLIYDNVKIKKE